MSRDVAADNLAGAFALVDALAGAGVRRFVLSPGSRSTPLVLALERHPAARLWVQLDERCAGYFALGLAKADGEPAALVCTSGTAAANWLPAVVEANQGNVPLVLLTADRPPQLRDCGANQTVDQLKLFGAQVRHFHELALPDASPATLDYLRAAARRAADLARWPLPGPVHLNVPFAEPLVPAAIPELTPRPAVPAAVPRLEPAPEAVAGLAARFSGRPGIIVCGPGRYPRAFPGAVAALADALAAPILGDPLSNLRCGGHDRSRVLARYDAFLRRDAFLRDARPRWVLRFGDLPVSKALQDWLGALRDCETVLADRRPLRADPLHAVGEVVHADEDLLCAALSAAAAAPAPRDWLRRWSGEEARAARLAESPEAATLEGATLAAISRLAAPGTAVFAGNSLVVRDVDTYLAGRGQPLFLTGNRGASGIDGNVSTALGLAAGRGRALALLGDLALAHDLGGLAAAPGLDAVLVVFANGGGAIFGYLPQARLASFERFWLTPSALDLAKVAELYGLGYARAESAAAIGDALGGALAGRGSWLVEVRVDREASLRAHRAYWELVAAG
jgi:2-succinyl-5-enolpyruvyl-6-hydroxy-3-cyclohexene-1-carboxylate synthase